MKKKILIINTGGTISSVKSGDGYIPAPDYITTVLDNMPELKHPDMPEYTIIEYKPLLDSANITVPQWNRIAQDIFANYARYDGFVILHGTDTMAYSASALSFMLENLTKPVILTGSQIPLSQARNDAKENIICAMMLAANNALHEVCIYFNYRLLRGNRAQKVSAYKFSAFDSPNYPWLANIGISIELNRKLIQSRPQTPLSLQTLKPQFIANFRLFPGFSTQVLKHILQQPLKGLILETYGIGNAQDNDDEFLTILKKATSQGMIIVNCSQCQEGKVDMNAYATGSNLKKAGLISGFDMTPEAAHCKLLYLMNKSLSVEKIESLMQQNLCGELSA